MAEDEEVDYMDGMGAGVSKINSAMIVNATLNELWKDFFRHFRAGKYLSSNNDLDCVWTILGGEKNIEGSEKERQYIVIEKLIFESGVLQDSVVQRGFLEIDETFIRKSSKQKALLLKKALFLRRLQNEQGKGTAYNMGEEDYLD